MTRKGRRCRSGRRGDGGAGRPAGARAALLVFGSMHADAEHEPAAARGTEGDDPSCFPFGPRSVIDRSRWNRSMLETGGHVPRSACRRGVASPRVRAWPVTVVAYTATGGRAGRGSSSSIRVIYVSPHDAREESGITDRLLHGGAVENIKPSPLGQRTNNTAPSNSRLKLVFFLKKNIV